MAKKIIPQEEVVKIKESLKDSKSTNRRSAAKKIGKLNLRELGDDLFFAYQEEKKIPVLGKLNQI